MEANIAAKIQRMEAKKIAEESRQLAAIAKGTAVKNLKAVQGPGFFERTGAKISSIFKKAPKTTIEENLSAWEKGGAFAAGAIALAAVGAGAEYLSGKRGENVDTNQSDYLLQQQIGQVAIENMKRERAATQALVANPKARNDNVSKIAENTLNTPAISTGMV